MNDSRNNHLYWIAVALSIVINAIHWWILPALMTPDGFVYIQLSDLLFTENSLERWDYQRLPFYPLLLKGSFLAFGKGPHSATLPGALMGLAGILMLGSLARRSAGNTSGAIVVLLLTAFPLLIAYQHTLLTEIGTFFFLAALLWGVSWDAPFARAKPLLLAAIVAIGYFHRPTLLYLAPLAAVLHCVDATRSMKWRPLFVDALLIVAIPFCISLIWNHGERARRIEDRFGYALVHFLAKQAVIPPGHELRLRYRNRAGQFSRL